MKLNELSAVEAARLISEGRITSEDLVKACLQRIEDRDSVVRAWEYIDPKKALERAILLDQAPMRGLLHGIPVGIKDIVDTVDMPTAYGSPIYAGHNPSGDASCVALTRTAGGLVLGKTVTTEFACRYPGKTANPHNPTCTPGGSSSGSAAAVADFMIPLAIGTQTAGSVIRPASYCGVVGYKPTFGLINRAGVKPLAESLDTIGVFARSVEDAAFFVSILTGRASLTLRKSRSPPRVGICRTYEWPNAAPEMVNAFEQAEKQLFASEASIKEVNLPEPFSRLADAHIKVMNFEAARSLAYEQYNHKNRISNVLLQLIASGQACLPEQYDAAQDLATKCFNLLEDVFSDLDVLLTPSAMGEAPEGLAFTGDPTLNRIWTFLHVPCVNIPAFTSPRGLPIGLQVVGRFGDDARTLTASDWILGTLKNQ